MKSFLDQIRSEWNAPLNNIRREKNKELREQLEAKKELEGDE